MWSHYADDCRGVAIGYNVDRWVTHLLARIIQCAVKGAIPQRVRIPPGNCRSSR